MSENTYVITAVKFILQGEHPTDLEVVITTGAAMNLGKARAILAALYPQTLLDDIKLREVG